MESGEEQKKIKGPWFWVILIGGVGCLGLLCVIGILAAIFLPALAQARKMAKITDCKNNQKQLGIYLQTYVARYGNDTAYPPAPGMEFWETLWAAPDADRAISHRPGEDPIFLCKVYGPAAGRSNRSLDYTSPAFTNDAVYPGGKLAETVRGDTMIGGDIVEGDLPNHGGTPGAPSEIYNALFFDGSVRSVQPGSPEDQAYRRSTTGARVR